MLARNFHLIPNSVSYAVASKIEFLTRDGLFTKFTQMCDFIMENTP